MLFFLMRMWPVGGRMGLGEGETLVMSVPFSEFIKRVKHDDVQSVAVDGMHISFSLKPSSLALPGELLAVDLCDLCTLVTCPGPFQSSA
jgi:hypothetical protein